jgi:hypothetical protein
MASKTGNTNRNERYQDTSKYVKKAHAAVVRRGGFMGRGGRGESNFDVYGITIDKKSSVKNLEDGVYIVKEGVCKRMKDSKKSDEGITSFVAVVYRVPPRVPDKEPEKKATKKAVKKEEPKASKKAPVKAPEKKAPVKAAKKEVAKAPVKKAKK